MVSGPNLNLLGEREPETYGTTSLADIEALVRGVLEPAGVTVATFQSNHEGEIVDAIHAARAVHDAIIINPGALTHYSWTLHDALKSFPGTVIEVHISNPQSREPFRHGSVVSSVANGTIAGFGASGYALAAHALLQRRG